MADQINSQVHLQTKRSKLKATPKKPVVKGKKSVQQHNHYYCLLENAAKEEK